MSAIEWLRSLDERPDGYGQLLAEASCFAEAAWRFASARIHVTGFGGTPSRRELRAAAALLARRAGVRAPSTTSLLETCDDRGLPLLA